MKQRHHKNYGLDIDSFELDWLSASETEQLAMVSKAVKMPPGQGIIPILSGIDSYHRSIRNRSKKGLALLGEKLALLHQKLEADPDTKKRLLYIKESSFFASAIYRMLKTEITVNETKLFISILLDAGGRGPFYVWKFFQRNEVSLFLVKSVFDSLSEFNTLLMVDQYLISPPSIKRKFAAEIKRVLKKLANPDAAIRFFAHRFTMVRDADPFLNHMAPGLRNPDPLKEIVLKSPDPFKRIEALKALAMMDPGIQASFLLHLIKTQKEDKMTAVVFGIIQRSGKGRYPELIEPILDRLDDFPPPVAIQAFRALAKSSLDSLDRFLVIVEKAASRHMPGILAEITSRPEDYFLSVMASLTDKAILTAGRPDIFKALMVWVIQKRPERALKLLALHCNHPDDKTRQWIDGLSSKIKQYLAQEKKQITSLSKQLMDEHTNQEKKQSKGFLKQVFSKSVDQKIAALKESSSTGYVDFKHDSVEKLDLSAEQFHTRALFNEAVIRDSDLSQSSFINFLFNKSVFYNVNFDGSTFDSISFNRAVFINVSAKKSQFINCSFQDAVFLNVDFESAFMEDAVLTGALISRCSFINSDLSGASFAAAAITASSFADAVVIQTDFSAVQAKFSRFPFQFFSSDSTEHADFCTGAFQLANAEIPDRLFQNKLLKDTLLEEMKLLILTQFVSHGRSLFLRKNQFSILTALDGLKSKQTHLFEIIPLLLHEHLEFPGYGPRQDVAPYGIFGYVPSPTTRQIVTRYPMKSKPVKKPNASFLINALFTTGDTGSIAQSKDTTIHYVLFMNDCDSDDPLMAGFHKKLHLLKLWAKNSFKTRVSFGLIHPKQVLDTSWELSNPNGNPSRMILDKETFFRTMIHLAGKLPLWSLFPSKICKTYYRMLSLRLCNSLASSHYMDLGDLHHLSVEAYFHQSVNQLFTHLDKPFESLIRFSLIEKFFQSKPSEPLLCNRFKDNWMTKGFQTNFKAFDPCHILIASLIDFYEKQNNPDAIQLMIISLFLKLQITDQKELNSSFFGLKGMFIRESIKEWSWNQAMVFDSGRYDQWPYARVNKFSSTLAKHIVNAYRNIHSFFDMAKNPDLMVSPQIRTLFAHKMLAQFSKQADKIEKMLPISSNKNYFDSFGLNYVKSNNETARWTIIEWSGKIVRGKEQVLKEGVSLESLGGWLVHNRLLSKQPLIHLVPNTLPVTLNDIKELLNELQLFLVPEKEDDIEASMFGKPKIISLFLSLNLCSDRTQKKVTHWSALYSNSWGEIFQRSFYSKEGHTSMEALLKEVKGITGIESLPQKIKIHRPKSAQLQLKR